MKMIFQVCIETREATQEEVFEALDIALQVLDMPNGDTLEPDSISIEYVEMKPPNRY